jgi:5,10-methylene-tetrahydrofolate dehydrogenase/methenyl tetrahydrofolate cyclohydrolase
MVWFYSDIKHAVYICVGKEHQIYTMAEISVVLVGGSGALGEPLLQELIRQRDSFRRIAVLATPERAHKFKDAGIKVVSGSLISASSYQGQY